MPLLDKRQISEMLATQRGCGQCGRTIRQNYCREHDEFFWTNHSKNCPQVSEHEGHRSYQNALEGLPMEWWEIPP